MNSLPHIAFQNCELFVIVVSDLAKAKAKAKAKAQLNQIVGTANVLAFIRSDRREEKNTIKEKRKEKKKRQCALLRIKYIFFLRNFHRFINSKQQTNPIFFLLFYDIFKVTEY